MESLLISVHILIGVYIHRSVYVPIYISHTNIYGDNIL